METCKHGNPAGIACATCAVEQKVARAIDDALPSEGMTLAQIIDKQRAQIIQLTEKVEALEKQRAELQEANAVLSRAVDYYTGILTPWEDG